MGLFGHDELGTRVRIRFTSFCTSLRPELSERNDQRSVRIPQFAIEKRVSNADYLSKIARIIPRPTL